MHVQRRPLIRTVQGRTSAEQSPRLGLGALNQTLEEAHLVPRLEANGPSRYRAHRESATPL